MNSSGSKRYLQNASENIVKGDWTVFDISNMSITHVTTSRYAFLVALGWNHFYCLPNKPLKYFIMNYPLIFQMIQEQGGASYNLHTTKMNPDTGFMVALSGFEKVYSIPNYINKLVDIVIDFSIQRGVWDKIAENPDNTYLGFWVNDGKLYLDLSENISDIGTAYHLGIEQNQIAIYDCVNKADIKVQSLELV